MKEWKAIGALLLTGAIIFMQGIVPAGVSTDTQIVAKAETLTYEETQSLDIYNGSGGITATCQYILTENQFWDDTIGAPVYDRYITITDITLEVYVDLYTYPPSEYMSYSSYAKMRSIEASNDVVNYTIPAEIDGVPVRVLDASICCGRRGNDSYKYNVINVTIPESINEIKHFAYRYYSDSYIANLYLPSTVQKIDTLQLINSTIFYDGTCSQLFAAYPYIKAEDGRFTCTDGKLILERSTSITYDGTCAQWAEICPVNLVSCEANCSDGQITVDPPVPTYPHYEFDKSTKTAVYIGGEAETLTSLTIPAMVEGYTVTGIADEALVGYANLTAVEIPSTVTKIGRHAVGYWKNSDGSYSPMSKVVIYCEEGSTAQAYALENGLSYQVGSAPLQTTPQTTTITETTTTTTTETWTEPPATSVTTQPTTPPTTSRPSTTTTTTTTTTSVPSITFEVHYGDVDCDGDVDIMDVILLNRSLMIGAPVSVQGMINADVDCSNPNMPDAVDALNILKAVVKLITLPVE